MRRRRRSRLNSQVDTIRRHVARVVTAFPGTLTGYRELGYTRAEAILNTPITTQEQVADWADSIFNASVPLPKQVLLSPEGWVSRRIAAAFGWNVRFWPERGTGEAAVIIDGTCS
ncbi:MAG: hypothetical protein QOC98_1699, partial [Frankiaceae bacterium]|nr:hypothetical protein [Frankiaceae bacterium]